MGRLGPAFLAYENFGIYWEWNQSSNYSLSAAYFATRLGGAPRAEPRRRPGDPLRRRDARGAGAAERHGPRRRRRRTAASARSPAPRVKQAQLAFGLPADGYPTRELLQRLREGVKSFFRRKRGRRVLPRAAQRQPDPAADQHAAAHPRQPAHRARRHASVPRRRPASRRARRRSTRPRPPSHP